MQQREDPADASSSAMKLRAVCRHWLRLGGHCSFGSECKFRHPGPEELSRLRQETTTTSTTTTKTVQTTGGALPKKRRKKVRNKNKANCFRRWLIDTFGRERLLQGVGVLEVAGGKGELSFQLVNLNGVSCTVVEPRPLELKHYQRRLLYGLYHRCAPPFRAYLDTEVPPVSAEEVQQPAHFRLFFTRELWQQTTGEDEGRENELRMKSALKEAKSVLWTEKGLVAKKQVEQEGRLLAEDGYRFVKQRDNSNSSTATNIHTTTRTQNEEETEEEEKENDTNQIREEKDNNDTQKEEEEEEHASESFSKEELEEVEKAKETLDWNNFRRVLEECSVVVGMHPDQAAEAIVDFALEHNKAFAVVPCCTYYHQFPHRRLPNGQPVKSYQQLLQYLQAKDPQRIRLTEVPSLDGKNKVLYYVP
ncbi:Zinc finger, CCCH-type [Balamuthia mandrillaris]